MSGSAYVFVRPATGWASATQTAKLTASDGAANDQFGCSVAVVGDTVVVGAYRDDAPAANSGSAYVFVKPATGWATAAETAKLTASDGAGSDHFGYSVAVDRGPVAVGAHLDNSPSVNSGSAYVYQVKPWTPIPGSGATTTSHTVTGLTNYQPYTFWLRVVNAVAASLAADTATLEVVENSDGGTNVGSAFTATDPGQQVGVHVAVSAELMAQSGRGYFQHSGDVGIVQARLGNEVPYLLGLFGPLRPAPGRKSVVRHGSPLHLSFLPTRVLLFSQ